MDDNKQVKIAHPASCHCKPNLEISQHRVSQCMVCSKCSKDLSNEATAFIRTTMMLEDNRNGMFHEETNWQEDWLCEECNDL